MTTQLVSLKQILAFANVSPTTANVTLAKNTLTFLDLSGLTANRNLVVPAGVEGDQIELNVLVGDDTYYGSIIGDTGITINGGAAATAWGVMKIAGESVVLVATSSTNWQIRSSKLLLSFYDSIDTTGENVTLSNAAYSDIFSITLPPGRWILNSHITLVGAATQSVYTRIYNNTDAVQLAFNSSTINAAGWQEATSLNSDVLTLTSEKVIKVQGKSQTATSAGYAGYSSDNDGSCSIRATQV